MATLGTVVREDEASAESLRSLLKELLKWRSDPAMAFQLADDSAWWTNASIMHFIGEQVAALFDSVRITAVMGPASRGLLVGALAARALSVGPVEVRKGAERAADDDAWFTQITAPDHNGRQIQLAVRRSVISPGARILFVDDWIDSGAQAMACKAIVEQAGAKWVGASVVVDSLSDNRIRLNLNVRGILNANDL